ncbi:MAG: efflux RND transporter periplasmic adaptor subunit [Myxococcales bacterium]|nr:MAG: efflux RND transporter periplasmic adaptor subunit [Myxococcales bacterium]
MELRLPGEVEGAREALLAAPLGGFIEAVNCHKGDKVKQGTPLVRVDSSTYYADLARVQAEHNQAEADLTRSKQLKDTIPRAELEAAETRYLAVEASLKSAQIRATRSVLRAPFSGTIADIDVERGEVASPGAPLVRLVQLDPVKVTLSVPDRDVVALKQGLAVEVTSGASGQVFQGQIAHISPAADPKTRAFEVDVSVANKERHLLPGMIANVLVKDSVTQQGIVLPQGIVVTRLKENGVFVIEGRKAHWRTLKLGRVIGDQIVVDEGLKEGEVIATTGQRNLVRGRRIVIARKGKCCQAGRIFFEESK